MMAPLTESAFAERAEPHRRELHVHCYRMVGSFETAEDMVQETLARAWRARDRFGGDELFRAWLYRIATNVCLDEIRRGKRQATTLESMRDVPWLQPYPDTLLDEVAPRGDEPEAALVSRESTRLAFVAVIQSLPPKQRATLVLRDVVGWSAEETAAALDLSVASANSALQRARATLRERLPALEEASPALEATERRLLEVFMRTHESGDVDAAVAVMREDIRVTMPPHPMVFDGIDTVAELVRTGIRDGSHGDWLLVPTRANRMPAAASYLRAPGDDAFRAFKFDLLRVREGGIAEITTFDKALFGAFGLPEVWER